jgi:hypothetical protein
MFSNQRIQMNEFKSTDSNGRISNGRAAEAEVSRRFDASRWSPRQNYIAARWL